MAIACRHGYGAVLIVNVDPRLSVQPLDDVVADPENERHVKAAIGQADAVWIAWGSALAQLPSWVTTALAGANLWSLGRTRSGAPKHPARKSYDAKLVRESVV